MTDRYDDMAQEELLLDRIADLERENAELRRDKERLDWLELRKLNVNYIGTWWKHDGTGQQHYWIIQDHEQVVGNLAKELTLRAAIDAAIRQP